MPSHREEAARPAEPLKHLSFDRLTSLLRHWKWAEEAKQKYERELASYADEHSAGSFDQLLGSYYHWCGMLCALGEASLAHDLVQHPPLDRIHNDLESVMPWLRVCRTRLVDVPASHEHHPNPADMRRDTETLARLRRVHRALGEAFRNEQVSREVDSLDHQ